MFDRTTFERVARETGLTKGEFATVLGVTRQTVYEWLGGGEPHQDYLLRLVNRATASLAIAVERRVLPLPRKMQRPERAKKIALMADKLHGTAART